MLDIDKRVEFQDERKNLTTRIAKTKQFDTFKEHRLGTGGGLGSVVSDSLLAPRPKAQPAKRRRLQRSLATAVPCLHREVVAQCCRLQAPDGARQARFLWRVPPGAAALQPHLHSVKRRGQGHRQARGFAHMCALVLDSPPRAGGGGMYARLVEDRHSVGGDAHLWLASCESSSEHAQCVRRQGRCGSPQDGHLSPALGAALRGTGAVAAPGITPILYACASIKSHRPNMSSPHCRDIGPSAHGDREGLGAISVSIDGSGTRAPTPPRCRERPAHRGLRSMGVSLILDLPPGRSDGRGLRGSAARQWPFTALVAARLRSPSQFPAIVHHFASAPCVGCLQQPQEQSRAYLFHFYVPW